jgi:outer membrane protein OmpA-like peptidoglycan-associated protein
MSILHPGRILQQKRAGEVAHPNLVVMAVTTPEPLARQLLRPLPLRSLASDRRNIHDYQNSYRGFGGHYLCRWPAIPGAVTRGGAAVGERHHKRAKTPRITRGLTTSPSDAARAADETRFLSAVRNRPTRSLSTEELDKIASIANSKPKIDLEINFEYNSAVIGSKAMPQVTELGKALTSEDLKGRTFILAGFTDAKGSETYNQGLSERRADAVKQFLSEKYGIDARNLVTVGYGLKQLKDPANPFAAENRRVQVVNAGDK